jgi:hypothetical protein
MKLTKVHYAIGGGILLAAVIGGYYWYKSSQEGSSESNANTDQPVIPNVDLSQRTDALKTTPTDSPDRVAAKQLVYALGMGSIEVADVVASPVVLAIAKALITKEGDGANARQKSLLLKA